MIALNQKKGVLCEKPICINSNQLALLSKKALGNNLFLMEAMWTRFLPSFNKVLDLITSGVIGKVKAVKADFGYSLPYDESHRLYNPNLGGGSLLDIGIYPVFLALAILGIPDKILASAYKTNLGVDSTYNIIFNYKNGDSANLYSSVIYKTSNEADIYEEKGLIKINSPWYNTNSITLQLANEIPRTIQLEKSEFGYSYEAIHVMECLSKNKVESDIWSLNSSKSLLNILDRIRKIIKVAYPGEKL